MTNENQISSHNWVMQHLEVENLKDWWFQINISCLLYSEKYYCQVLFKPVILIAELKWNFTLL